MKIGIDIDNTIAPTFKSIINFINKKYGYKKKANNSKNPVGYDLFHSSFKDFYMDWKGFVESDTHEKMLPINGSVKTIERLSKKHQIYILTARGNSIRTPTILWIDKNYKNKFEEIIFTNYDVEENEIPQFTKGDICLKYGLDVIIEDDLNHIKDILAKSKKTKPLLFNKDKKYSWIEKKEIPKGVVVVANWKDVEKKIEKMSKKRK